MDHAIDYLKNIGAVVAFLTVILTTFQIQNAWEAWRRRKSWIENLAKRTEILKNLYETAYFRSQIENLNNDSLNEENTLFLELRKEARLLTLTDHKIDGAIFEPNSVKLNKKISTPDQKPLSCLSKIGYSLMTIFQFFFGLIFFIVAITLFNETVVGSIAMVLLGVASSYLSVLGFRRVGKSK